MSGVGLESFHQHAPSFYVDEVSGHSGENRCLPPARLPHLVAPPFISEALPRPKSKLAIEKAALLV